MNSECPLCGAEVAGDECNCGVESISVIIPTGYPHPGGAFCAHKDFATAVAVAKNLYGKSWLLYQLDTEEILSFAPAGANGVQMIWPTETALKTIRRLMSTAR